VLSVRGRRDGGPEPGPAAFLKEIGARVVHVSQAAVDSEFAVVDIDATYAAGSHNWAPTSYDPTRP